MIIKEARLWVSQPLERLSVRRRRPNGTERLLRKRRNDVTPAPAAAIVLAWNISLARFAQCPQRSPSMEHIFTGAS